MMTLKNYCLGVAFLTALAACGGTIVGDSQDSKDGGNSHPSSEAGVVETDSGVPVEAAAPDASA